METANITGWQRKWEQDFSNSLEKMLRTLPGGTVSQAHIATTPDRVVRAFGEFFSGCFQDPKEVLKRSFASDCGELVYVNNIGFVSYCAHHLVPFMGKVHFAYLPAGRIIGLSKIPRLVEILAKRPQVQEDLTAQIVDTFSEVLKPAGCGAVVEAYHLCMAIRGVKKPEAYTRTTAIRGVFRTNPTLKSEFIEGVKPSLGGSLWP